MRVSRDAKKKETQLKKNMYIISTFNNTLASLGGSERYLSVGTSHTVAFCKALNAWRTTPINELNSNGCLNLGTVLAGKEKDRPFQTMCVAGWEWLIIFEFVEDMRPDFPALAQQSLNSAHSVSKQLTEMETAAIIAERYQKTQQMGQPASLASAVHAAGQSEPKRKEYLDSVAAYVKLYVGGEDFPIVHFLESFFAQYGCSLVIGEEFMDATINLHFKAERGSYLRPMCN